MERRGGWKEKKPLDSKKRTSFAEVAKNGLTRDEKEKRTKTNEGENFPKPGPPGFKDGSKREIKVRPVTYNGRVFSGFITCIEATKNMYQEGMKLNTTNLHGVSFLRDSDDNLTIVFKLKNDVDLAALRGRFDYKRSNKAG